MDDIVLQSDKNWLLSIGGDRPQRLVVDGIILAIPAHHAARLVAQVSSLLAAELAQIPYSSCAVISLGYDRDQIGHSLNGAGVVVPLVERRNILSCSFSSIKYDGRAPQDCALLRVFVGGACQSGLLQLPDEQLIELAAQEIGELLDIRGAPVLRNVTRHRHAMPQYHVGHRQRVTAIERRLARLPTLALAGSGYDGIGVPACIRSGQAAANRVLMHLNASAIPPHAHSASAETAA